MICSIKMSNNWSKKNLTVHFLDSASSEGTRDNSSDSYPSLSRVVCGFEWVSSAPTEMGLLLQPYHLYARNHN
jgi:hypothetical protein